MYGDLFFYIVTLSISTSVSSSSEYLYLYKVHLLATAETVTRTADHPFNDNQKVEHLVFLDILLHRLMPHPHRK